MCAPLAAWVHHAEFDRNAHPFEARYFHSAGEERIEVPVGTASIEVMKGLERTPQHLSVPVAAGAVAEAPVVLPARAGLHGAPPPRGSAGAPAHLDLRGHPLH